jgi:hypothetical protein
MAGAVSIAILENVGRTALVIDGGHRDFVEIAAAFSLVVVGRQTEGRGLHEHRSRPLDGGPLILGCLRLCHVDADAFAAFTAKHHAPNGLAAAPDRVVDLSPDYLHGRIPIAGWMREEPRCVSIEAPRHVL